MTNAEDYPDFPPPLEEFEGSYWEFHLQGGETYIILTQKHKLNAIAKLATNGIFEGSNYTIKEVCVMDELKKMFKEAENG